MKIHFIVLALLSLSHCTHAQESLIGLSISFENRGIEDTGRPSTAGISFDTFNSIKDLGLDNFIGGYVTYREGYAKLYNIEQKERNYSIGINTSVNHYLHLSIGLNHINRKIDGSTVNFESPQIGAEFGFKIASANSPITAGFIYSSLSKSLHSQVGLTF